MRTNVYETGPVSITEGVIRDSQDCNVRAETVIFNRFISFIAFVLFLNEAQFPAISLKR